MWSRRVNGRRLWLQRLLPITLLVWAYLLVRLLNIEGWNAYFIDEILHMNRAQVVLKFTDLQVSATPGKFLLYYYLSLFQLPDHEPIWLARTAVSLFSVAGLAAAYGLGRQLFSHRAGMLSVVILAVWPLMVFHEKQVLSDPLAATTVTLVLWWSVVVAKRPTLRRATLLGVLVCLMLAAKVIAVPLLAAPFLAVLLFAPQSIQLRHRIIPQIKALWVQYWPQIRRAAIVILIVWVPIMIVYQIRFTFFPETTSPIVVDYIYAGLVEEYDQTTQDVIQANLEHLAEMFRIMWGLLLIIPTVIGTVYAMVRRPRAGGYLILSIALIWLPLIVLAARPNSRYYMVMAPVSIVLLAGGIMLLVDDLKRTWPGRAIAAIPVVSIIAWIALYALPFDLEMANNATSLTYTSKDTDGYFRRYTSYGIEDALETILAAPPLEPDQSVPTVFVVNAFCGSMPYLYPEGTPIAYRCPTRYDPKQTTRAQSLSQDLQKVLSEDGSVYMIHDRLSALDVNDLDIPGQIEPITTYQRPFDGHYVDLYRVIADDSVARVADGQD